MNPWLIWLIAAIVFLIIEVCSGTVVALCLAVGCLLAIIPAAFDSPVVVQFIVAAIGSVVSFLVLSPIIRKYRLNKATRRDERSNMDALIGRTGVVTETIYPENRQGRVRVDGDNWLAVADPQYCPIMIGENVEVLSYDSIVIKVKPKEK